MKRNVELVISGREETEPGTTTPSRICAIAVLAMAVFSVSGHGQGTGLPARPSGAVSSTAYFGPLTPGKVGTPASVVLPFSLPVAATTAAKGYRVTAVSNFVFTPSANAGGGKSITAADIGIGVVSVSPATGFAGNASVAAGFDYDPGAAAVSGVTKNGAQSGVAFGRATLGDLQSGRDIVRVGTSATGKNSPAMGQLDLSLKVAVPTQYFTPGSFSGSVTLRVME